MAEMSRSRTPLIIPSEIQAREFDAKLLLACVATERGFNSIVGCRTDIHLRVSHLPRGIYVAKDVRRSSQRMFRILEKLGHPIVALDEEAPFFYSREFYFQTRVSEATLRHTRELFAWGPENAEAWRHFPRFHGAPVHETGNPRVDMMRPELRGFFDAEVDALRRRFGRFILINTNFGKLNHFYPNLTTLPPPGTSSEIRLDVDAGFKAGLTAHRHAIFRSFIELVPQIAAAFPQHLVIVRPHPAESHDIWREAGAGARNLRVIHEGGVIPWLLAADAVIHNSCTTGFESYLVGTPVIAYQPVVSERFDHRLPNELSHRADSAQAVIDATGAAIDGRLTPSDAERTRRHALAASHVAALDGPLASERIVDLLDRFELAVEKTSPSLAALVAGHAAAFIRRKGKERNETAPGHKNNIDYTRHRFPGIEVDEVNRRIDRLRATLGRFPNARARQLSSNIFEIGEA
jgi:surface carbohydrate biosynthesis protein